MQLCSTWPIALSYAILLLLSEMELKTIIGHLPAAKFVHNEVFWLLAATCIDPILLHGIPKRYDFLSMLLKNFPYLHQFVDFLDRPAM